MLPVRLDVAPDGIDLRLRMGGFHSLTGELVAEGGNESTDDAETSAEEVAA